MSEILSIVCPHVFNDERAVHLLVHHGDGTWQAVCGERDHSEDCADFRLVGINHLFDRQGNLAELRLLPPDCLAEWIDGRWEKSPFDENEPD